MLLREQALEDLHGAGVIVWMHEREKALAQFLFWLPSRHCGEGWAQRGNRALRGGEDINGFCRKL